MDGGGDLVGVFTPTGFLGLEFPGETPDTLLENTKRQVERHLGSVPMGDSICFTV